MLEADTTLHERVDALWAKMQVLWLNCSPRASGGATVFGCVLQCTALPLTSSASLNAKLRLARRLPLHRKASARLRLQ